MASDSAKAKKFARYNREVASGKRPANTGGGKAKSSGYKPDPNYVSPF